MLPVNAKSWLTKLKFLLVLIPLLCVSDQLWAKDTKLLILGDSLSAGYGISLADGWVSLLQDMWRDDSIEVVNAAISGETTDGALARLPRLLEQHAPSHLYIELGGNDGLQGHPVAKMQSNLIEMIELAKQQNIQVILQAMQIPPNYGRRYTDMFAQSFKDIAAETNISLIPFFLADIATNPELMQRDGIHPNAAAQESIAQAMYVQFNSILAGE